MFAHEFQVLKGQITQFLSEDGDNSNAVTRLDPESNTLKKFYKCKFCDEKFSKACSLGGHISRKHKNDGALDEKRRSKNRRDNERIRKTYLENMAKNGGLMIPEETANQKQGGEFYY